MCEVVNLKTQEYDVLIARPSKWGNPYSHKVGTAAKYKVSSRKEAVRLYEVYLLGNKELMDSLPELVGMRLGCYCAPKLCHGNVLKKYVDRIEKGIDPTVF